MTANPVASDRFAAARSVADAVLYEGYILYPYRASAGKNQVRWQFGVLVPPAVEASDPSERSSMQTECVVDVAQAVESPVRVWLRARFLQAQHRLIQAATEEPDVFVPAARLEVDGDVHVSWDEALERSVDVGPSVLLPVEGFGYQHDFAMGAGQDTATIHDAAGRIRGRAVRTRSPLTGRISVGADRVDGSASLVKLRVVVENTTPWTGTEAPREETLRHSLVAVHIMLALEGAAFVSMLDPPAGAAAAVSGCVNDGAFPVLVGCDDVVLSSPIILYDHPEVAPESPGDLYDATEIDEILALRILTLTEQERAEARGTDPRSAAIIDRCDAMSPESWERLHGVVRSVGPAAGGNPGGRPDSRPWWDPGSDRDVDPVTDSVVVAGVELRRGSRVVLRPSRRADAHDLFLAGLDATVAGVFRDVDGNEYVAVTVDDDPATEALEWQGRYLYFFPDEVEPAHGMAGTG
jgi:hypothetical protein